MTHPSDLSCALPLQVAMVNSRVEAPLGGGAAAPGRSCAGCGGRIADRVLLFSMERYWHTRCLKCSCCHAQLGEFSSTCYSKGGMVLCRNDYCFTCATCRNRLVPGDRFHYVNGAVFCEQDRPGGGLLQAGSMMADQKVC
ncbi:LIM domain transcription factor LMO4.1 [Liparis tanakae]|uniref:LIM domain transcription factor LMO4.1 n=1 Tax=Liparis tanakae TaxID=230148 RepID=A0A4Z2EJX1_9TELE|nr:LIM domain transcription factor LMO4.1 [Liparis tanakae]